MLKSHCIHPEILQSLSQCGHGDKILIVDGNYPINSGTSRNTNKVYLNLTHGIPLVTDVLETFNNSFIIEKAEIMLPDDENELPIHEEFKSMLPHLEQLDGLKRFEFYEVSKNEDVKLAVMTGDQRPYGNILLTMGVLAR